MTTQKIMMKSLHFSVFLVSLYFPLKRPTTFHVLKHTWTTTMTPSVGHPYYSTGPRSVSVSRTSFPSLTDRGVNNYNFGTSVRETRSVTSRSDSCGLPILLPLFFFDFDLEPEVGVNLNTLTVLRIVHCMWDLYKQQNLTKLPQSVRHQRHRKM